MSLQLLFYKVLLLNTVTKRIIVYNFWLAHLIQLRIETFTSCMGSLGPSSTAKNATRNISQQVLFWKLSVFSGTAIPMDSFIKNSFLIAPSENSHWQLVSEHPILVDFSHIGIEMITSLLKTCYFPQKNWDFWDECATGAETGTPGSWKDLMNSLWLVLHLHHMQPAHSGILGLLYDSRLLFHSNQTLAIFLCKPLLPATGPPPYSPPPTQQAFCQVSLASFLATRVVPFMTPTWYHFP